MMSKKLILLTTLIAASAFSISAQASSGASPGDKMAEIDTNGDGAISADERQALRAEIFDAMDENGDGVLSEAEMTAAREARKEKRKTKMQERRAQKREKMLAAMDENGDGQISRDEFVAKDHPRIAKIDTDGDGTISAEEMEAAKQNRRAMHKKDQ
jgi:EF hand domain-containing protein